MRQQEFADMDLISARKAALGFREDAMAWKEAAELRAESLSRSFKNYPILFLAGVLAGVLGCLIFASLI